MICLSSSLLSIRWLYPSFCWLECNDYTPESDDYTPKVLLTERHYVCRFEPKEESEEFERPLQRPVFSPTFPCLKERGEEGDEEYSEWGERREETEEREAWSKRPIKSLSVHGMCFRGSGERAWREKRGERERGERGERVRVEKESERERERVRERREKLTVA
jgi:hypothetical protein